MIFYLTTLPGWSSITTDELKVQLGQTAGKVIKLSHWDLLPVIDGDASRLRQLRTAEDVFVGIGSLDLTGRPTDVKALIAAGLWREPLQRALAEWSAATGRPLVKRLTWRVVVQAEDAAWRQYRRQELTMAAEAALLRVGGSWRVRRDEAPLELWLWQTGRKLLVTLRLTDNAARQHGGRAAQREAALRPSAAAALVWLTGPEPDDVFLDPMCGSGTLLLERAAAGRYQGLLGGDADPAAVAATLENFGPRHQPRRIERWDARQLPLADGSVSKIACNLPWGRKIGDRAAMPALYRDALAEMTRVLAPGGRAALLTSEWEALKAALTACPELRLERTVRDVSILGRRADVFVLRRL